jgi:hypothetical protein
LIFNFISPLILSLSKDVNPAKNLLSLGKKGGQASSEAVEEFKRGAAPLRKELSPLPPGGRVGRHPARIYSRWDTGNGIGQGEGD